VEECNSGFSGNVFHFCFEMYGGETQHDLQAPGGGVGSAGGNSEHPQPVNLAKHVLKFLCVTEAVPYMATVEEFGRDHSVQGPLYEGGFGAPEFSQCTIRPPQYGFGFFNLGSEVGPPVQFMCDL